MFHWRDMHVATYIFMQNSYDTPLINQTSKHLSRIVWPPAFLLPHVASSLRASNFVYILPFIRTYRLTTKKGTQYKSSEIQTARTHFKINISSMFKMSKIRALSVWFFGILNVEKYLFLNKLCHFESQNIYTGSPFLWSPGITHFMALHAETPSQKKLTP